MKKNYEDFKIRMLKENKDKYNNLMNMKEQNNETNFSFYKNKDAMIKNLNYNYLQQTASSMNKIKKSKSFKKNKLINPNSNNKYKKYKNIYNNFDNKDINKENITENKNFQKRLSSILINNNKNINQKNNSCINKDKSLYYTMQNYYRYSPNPEPMPKKIIYNSNKDNNLNDKNENIYNENIMQNDMKNIKEDKNILYLLSNLNLEYLYDVFISNYISFNDLFLLTKGDFSEMKIPIGPRNRILHFIYEYKKIAKNLDFQELSNFLCYYKKMINKPLINDINNNELFIFTNEINNSSFNCITKPIINNYLNNHHNEEIKVQKDIIEKTNLFQKNINNEKNIIQNSELDKEKTETRTNYNHNLSNNYNNDLTNIINNSKEKNKYNISGTKLKKYNSINSSKKNIFTNSTIKRFEFVENPKSYNNINTNCFDKSRKNNNIKIISSKNLKKKIINDENSKQNEKNHISHNKIYYNKLRYNNNILLKNSNNSNYLLQKFQRINKEVNIFQKNYTKIQKKTGNNPFISQNSQINDFNKELENEKIKNLNCELNFQQKRFIN